jgi:hypothetical protein
VNGFWDEVGRMGARVGVLAVVFALGFIYLALSAWLGKKKETK